MDSSILCQPDGSKGCSACCGLFNHRDISRVKLEEYLNGHSKTGDTEIIDESGLSLESFSVRDITSHICRFQSFLSPGRPGCSLHPKHRGSDGRDSSLFGIKICNDYLCPAHAILSEDQKNILFPSTEDWYAYSIAIIDPDSFIWILETVSTFKNISLIGTALRIHGAFLSEKECPIFYYSLAEYNQNKHSFTIGNNPKEQSYIKHSIREL